MVLQDLDTKKAYEQMHDIFIKVQQSKHYTVLLYGTCISSLPYVPTTLPYTTLTHNIILKPSLHYTVLQYHTKLYPNLHCTTLTHNILP